MASSPSPSSSLSGPTFSIPTATVSTPSFGQVLGNDIVDIYAGSPKVLYRVHKAVLCNSSEYFHKMFTNGFKETQDQAANFPVLGCHIFDLFLEWIYHGSIQSPPRSAVHDLARRLRTFNLVRLYASAEQICSENIKDYVMTLLISESIKHKVRLSITGTSRVYEITAAGSPLRAYAAQNLHYCMFKAGDEGTYATEKIIAITKKSEDLATDLMVLLRSKRNRPEDPAKLPLCTFHVHPKDEECRFKLDTPAPLPISAASPAATCVGSC